MATSPSPPSSLSSALPASPVSPSSIRRKPVPFIHEKVLTGETSPDGKSYIAINTTDAEESGRYVNKARDKTVSIFVLWKWELISLITSILSFLAIVVTLRVYQNHLVTKWKLPISINAIVSVLSTLFKGSLAAPVTEGISQLKWLWFSQQPRDLIDMDLYDKASRGTWGAIVMIYKQFRRGPKSILASFGALLALVTIAVDPFSQASVTHQPCWRPVDRDATIPRGNNYAAFGAHSGAGADGQTLDPPMSLAAYMGVLNPPPNSSASVQVSCRTNNCTYPSDQGATFSSLGVCALAWDISNQVTDLGSEFEKGYNYTLPWGINIGKGSLLGATSTMTPGTSFLPEGEGPWNRTSFIDVQLLGANYKNASCTYPDCDDWRFGPVAYMFSLLPCVQTFAANFTDGRYNETIIDEQVLHWVGHSVGYQLALNKTIHDGRWQECKGADKKTDTNTVKVYAPSAQGMNSPADELPVDAWHRPECVYGVGPGASQAISNFIGPDEFFYSKQALYRGEPGVFKGKIWMQNLWNNGNMSLAQVTTFAEGLARAVGARMRANPSDAADGGLRAARGVTLGKETCIVVEWKYLSFLATLLALDLVFFVVVVAINYRNRWGADWKSSTLAVAFQNVGSATGSEGEVPRPELDRHLREVAKSVKVSFTDVDGRWQLRKETDI